ncbi:MAG: peptidoglycan-binding protein [Nitratireductor sp.]|nr:peptidoglycan-binding protein [Nitratireductor sp.]
MSLLKKGMSGAPVKRLQQRLGVEADGIFGSGTEKALKDFQKDNGLAVDGIAGPETFTAMGLNELVLLRVGSRGNLVKKLQSELGVSADGAFGPGTKKAVADYQKAHGLEADGMAGPKTLATMASFQSDYSADTLKKAELAPDEESFESEPMPELQGSGYVKGAAADAAPAKSLWSKVKGWFS